jgi:hypothetical protein
MANLEIVGAVPTGKGWRREILVSENDLFYDVMPIP